MSGTLDLSSGALVSTYNGVTQFDTNQRGLFNKVPGAKVTLNNYSLSFPDLEYTVIYFLDRTIVNVGGTDFDRYGSHSWTQILPNEYGPGENDIYQIADVVVGTVPVGTNYLDVRGTFQVTKAPSWLVNSDGGQPIIPTGGETLRFEGGSIIVSRDLKIRRMMEFIISGTNLILRRRISVGTQGSNWLNLTNSVSTVDRWSTTLSNTPKNWYGTLGTNVDSRAVSGSISQSQAQRGGSASSSVDAVAAGISYEAIYNCNFEITPCRIQT